MSEEITAQGPETAKINEALKMIEQDEEMKSSKRLSSKLEHSAETNSLEHLLSEQPQEDSVIFDETGIRKQIPLGPIKIYDFMSSSFNIVLANTVLSVSLFFSVIVITLLTCPFLYTVLFSVFAIFASFCSIITNLKLLSLMWKHQKNMVGNRFSLPPV
jgi:hypothetical protein